jgi:hypothetical protein
MSTADLKLRAYNMSNASLVASVDLISSSNLMELTPSGNRLVHVFNQQVIVYDATTLVPVFQFQMNTDIQPGDNLISVAVPSDDRMYLTRTRLVQSGSFLINKAAILVYDLNTGAHVQSILDGPLPPVGQFVYSGGQSRLLANNLMVYEGVMTTQVPGALSKIEGDIVTETEYMSAAMPDPTNGNQILNARYNGNKIGVYDWPTHSYVNVINTLPDLNPTDFLPERNLVVGYRSGLVATVFDYATQQTIYSIQAGGFPLSLSGDYLYSSSGERIKIN